MSGNLKNAAMVLVAALCLSSCASIVCGSPKVVIDGDHSKSVTIVTEKKRYENVTLPKKVKVSSHKIKGQEVQVIAQDGKTTTFALEKKFNPWYLGNIFMNPLGFGIDLITNKISRPTHKHIIVSE